MGKKTVQKEIFDIVLDILNLQLNHWTIFCLHTNVMSHELLFSWFHLTVISISSFSYDFNHHHWPPWYHNRALIINITSKNILDIFPHNIPLLATQPPWKWCNFIVPSIIVRSIGSSTPFMLGIVALQVTHSSCSSPWKCSGSTKKLRPRVELSSPSFELVDTYEVTIHLSTDLWLISQLRWAAGKLGLDVQLILSLSPGR